MLSQYKEHFIILITGKINTYTRLCISLEIFSFHNILVCTLEVAICRDVKPKFKILKNILKLSKVVRYVVSKNSAL